MNQTLGRLRSLPPVWLVVPTVTLAVALGQLGPVATTDRPAAAVERMTEPRPARAARAVRSPQAAPAGRQPLAALVHATRPPLDVAPSVLADLVSGRARSWRSLGEPAASIRLVLTPESAPGAMLLWVLAGGAPARVRIRDASEAVSLVERDRDALALAPAGAAGPGVRAATLGGRDPLLEPTSYGLTVPAAAAPEAVTTVLAVGDILTTRTVHTMMVRNGWRSPWTNVRDRLQAADIAYGNHEGTISRTGRPRPGGTSFVSVPQVIEGLTWSGLDFVSLANNHTGDFGRQVLVETRELLEAAGMPVVGAGRNLSEAREPLIIERNGVRFGFLAFNAIVGPPAATEDEPGVVQIRMAPWFPFDQEELDDFTGLVRSLRPSVDVLIVYPHWGVEYVNTPNDDQRRVARAIVDAGADMVVATHAHWVAGAEVYKGKLIAYSMGNFVFDQTWSQETQEAVAVEMVFWGSSLKRAEFVPVMIESAHRPRFLSWKDGRHILERMWRGSGAPYSLGAA